MSDQKFEKWWNGPENSVPSRFREFALAGWQACEAAKLPSGSDQGESNAQFAQLHEEIKRLTGERYQFEKLFEECLYYQPPPAHTGDRLMAMWIAREGSRRGGGGRDPRPKAGLELEFSHGGGF